MTGPHPATLVEPTIPDGFEVIALGGTPYLRVIADGACLLATETHAEMLEAFGKALLGAAAELRARS